MIGVIDDTINNGEIVKSDQYHHEIVKDGYIVSLRKDYDGVKKNWVVTSFKLQNPNSKQPISDTTLSSPNINQGGRTVVANSADSAGKVTKEIPNEQGNAAEKSLPQRMEGESVMDYAARVDAWNRGQSGERNGENGSQLANDYAQDDVRFRIISRNDKDLTADDRKAIEQLDKGEWDKVYRAMQVIDGELYPPMAAKVDGKMVDGAD